MSERKSKENKRIDDFFYIWQSDKTIHVGLDVFKCNFFIILTTKEFIINEQK